MPSPKKSPAKAAASSSKAKPPHPPCTKMVMAAVRALKDRNGSSFPAIKKYIAANYKCDVQKEGPFIKRAVKSLSKRGKLVQTAGVGASGTDSSGRMKDYYQGKTCSAQIHKFKRRKCNTYPSGRQICLRFSIKQLDIRKVFPTVFAIPPPPPLSGFRPLPFKFIFLFLSPIFLERGASDHGIASPKPFSPIFAFSQDRTHLNVELLHYFCC